MQININNLKAAGKAMRSTRKSQGFTQKAFAMQLGISHFLARDIEQGKPSVKLGNFLKYAEELGIVLTMATPEIAKTNNANDMSRGR